MNWYASYTHAELSKKGIEIFLPTVRKLSQRKDRRKWVDFPIFPGYQVHPSPEYVLDVLKTRGAINLLSAQSGCPTPVATEEIGSPRILVQNGTDFDVYSHMRERALSKGRKGS